MHIAVMLVGYEEKIEEFIKDLQSRYYQVPLESKKMGAPQIARAKAREMKFYDLHFLEEIKPQVLSDLRNVCGATYSKEINNHSFKLKAFKFLLNILPKFIGMKVFDTEKYKDIKPSGMGRPYNYYLMHGLILGEMKDEVIDGLEQI